LVGSIAYTPTKPDQEQTFAGFPLQTDDRVPPGKVAVAGPQEA
jgi:hypothetical protein